LDLSRQRYYKKIFSGPGLSAPVPQHRSQRCHAQPDDQRRERKHLPGLAPRIPRTQRVHDRRQQQQQQQQQQ